MSSPEFLENLSPETLERLRELELFSRLRVEGLLQGENRSVLKGSSTDFISHRPYVPGDDIKFVDWRAYARSDRLTVKEYEDLTNVRAAVALDISNSMAFGEGEETKHDYALRAAALILYLLYMRRDRFSLHLFNDRVQLSLPAGTGQRHLLRAFRAMVEQEPRGGTDFQGPFTRIRPELKKRGIFILFSDCMDDPEKIVRSLLRFRLQGSDVIVFQVFHPDERDFPYGQMTRFTCLETGEVSTVDPLEFQRSYRENFAGHTEELQSRLRERGMDHARLPADAHYEAAVGDFIRRRMEVLS